MLLLLVGCKAGPSAFDKRPATDTAPAVARSAPAVADSAKPVSDSATAKPRAEEEAHRTARVVERSTRPPDTTSSEAVASDDGRTAASVTNDAPLPAGRPHFQRPKYVRGIYLNAWTAGSTDKVDTLLALAKRTEINSFVIDLKDASGYVSYASKVPLAVKSGATGQLRIHDLPGLLRRLEKAHIYPIARIVVIKDPILSKARPDLAIQDTAGGVWVDDKGFIWLNPYNQKVWDYAVDLAKEAVRYGFPEIQWDYVRFPDAPDSVLARATYPGADGRSKADAIRGFLQYSREQLGAMGAQVTADVFGVTASASHDVGIGQVWTKFISAVDVAQPMVYPSHYWTGSFGFANPDAYPYQVVRHALTDALRQSAEVKGAGKTRPWLQDFTLGRPPYGEPEVRAEIQATYDVGIHEWILWNPGSRYTEGALEPVGGFKKEPMIRVGGKVVPVSDRFRVLGETADGKPIPKAKDTAAAKKGAAVGTAEAKKRSGGAS